jgi:hypothetical protein
VLPRFNSVRFRFGSGPEPKNRFRFRSRNHLDGSRTVPERFWTVLNGSAAQTLPLALQPLHSLVHMFVYVRLSLSLHPTDTDKILVSRIVNYVQSKAIVEQNINALSYLVNTSDDFTLAAHPHTLSPLISSRCQVTCTCFSNRQPPLNLVSTRHSLRVFDSPSTPFSSHGSHFRYHITSAPDNKFIAIDHTFSSFCLSHLYH